MKKIVVLLLSALVLACSTTIKKSNTFIDYIPKDAQVIIKINDLEQTKNLLRDNDFIKKNRKLDFFSYFRDLPVLNQAKTLKGILCFSPIGKNDFEYTYISKYTSSILQKDSLQTKTIEAITYDTKTFHKVTSDKNTFYVTKQDSILIASSSQILIENAIRSQKNKTAIREDLKKAYEVASTEHPFSILFDGKELLPIHNALIPDKNFDALSNFSGWVSLDASVDQNVLSLDGIAIEKDSLSTTIGIFDNTIPQENQLARITPVSAKGFVSFTYDDFTILKKNLALAQDREIDTVPADLDEVLLGVSEIGMIFMERENVMALTSLDPENTAELLNGSSSGTYRNVPIYSYPTPSVFSEILTPLLPNFEAKYFILYEHSFLFASSKNALQTVIANLLNKNVLQEQEYYTNAIEKLPEASSILMSGSVKHLQEYISSSIQDDTKRKQWNEAVIKGYEIAALQIIKEDNFAHVHGVLKKNITKETATSVTQTTSTTLENKLLSKPFLVKNHRTKGMDIAVQDINNNLYLISDKGTIFWKKQINGAIKGEIKQIDIYKNGRYQLLFNTENTLYLVDRDGKDVSSYPKKFDQPITQPLALFDYDKNKRYRIVITQGNTVTMLNAEGDIVTGFGFKGTTTELIAPPKHIRIGSKDYILLSEKNGKLTILDRLGRNRVTVKDFIDFSRNDWYQYQNNFTSLTKDGKLVQVTSKGNVTSKDMGLKENDYITATNKTLVTFSENKLSIKGKTVELDFGTYTEPQLFYINNKIYISITDLQAKKVYLYDSNATLFPNFPVYGNSAISLGNMDKDPNLEFAVQSEENGVLIYQIN